MTDEEVKSAVRAICTRCQRHTDDDAANVAVIEMIKSELGYIGIKPAVTSVSIRLGESTMRSFMVMLMGPSGNTLQA